MIKWYHNSKTGEIGSYNEAAAGYELKGELYAYGDAVTTGISSKEKAIEWAKKWGYCPKCDGSSAPDTKIKGKRVCFRCGTTLQYAKIKEV